MREILFRGKRIDNGEWIEGYYAAEPYTKSTYNYGYILENEKDLYAKKAYLVDSRTVGQFTGLTDKNVRKIFEGDIVKYTSGSECFYHKVVFETRNFCCYFGIVISDIETWGFGMEVPPSMFEVIGNIHDNPELITCGANSEK